MSAIVGFFDLTQFSGELAEMFRAASEPVWLIVWGLSLLLVASRTRRIAAKAHGARLRPQSSSLSPTARGLEPTY
jgi:hypothetical protein